jgi:hypothetical protein
MLEQRKKEFVGDNNLEKTLVGIQEKKSQNWKTCQKKEENRAKTVMEMETSLHVSGLIGPQIDFGNENTQIHDEDVCDENDRIETMDTPSEGHDVSTCGI